MPAAAGSPCVDLCSVLQYFASHPYQYFAGPTPPILQMPMESEHASTAASPDDSYQPYPPPK